jgi:hypothetical protein
MQGFNCRQQLAAQHQRLHIVEQWPDGPRKEAAIGAIESTLDSLLRHPDIREAAFTCILCQSRKASVTVLEPADSRVRAGLDPLAGWKRAS